ncbi:7TM diverse intracellular signaling domain-containing protein [Cytophagaceae bacterium DM2B3-1]|uniref:histidine kinase n=1 Tax=Xanthocytophaga flava TaxID=3048013 RepID=A0ABT7CTK1_9BACT|nr:7TM diverse intracellular signaling domain-containing protein [Xanthocytophaga flavus]MDJ1496282.1 7TM diverse intracellular signaling domain-containing protein [Xanthocytophaga flavus]
MKAFFLLSEAICIRAWRLCIVIIVIMGMPVNAQYSLSTLSLKKGQTRYFIADHVQILLPSINLSDTALDLKTLTNQRFIPFSSLSASEQTALSRRSVHWIRFQLYNTDSLHTTFVLNVPTAQTLLYIPTSDQKYTISYPLTKENASIGLEDMHRFELLYREKTTLYLRLEITKPSSTSLLVRSIKNSKLYPEIEYQNRYTISMARQALFYGAMLVMLLYNLFVYVSLRQSTYLLFASFLLSLCIYISANSGYLYIFWLENFPKLDTYLKFCSAPVTLFVYIAFSCSYLERKYTTWLHKIANGLLIAFLLNIGLILLGYWYEGRMMSIILTLISIPFLIYLSINALHRGYSPAWYFLTANLIFLISCLIYAGQQLLESTIPWASYGIQIGAVLQVSIFSMGLVKRIDWIQNQLLLQIAENQRLEQSTIDEREQLILQKNKELEEKILKRTAQITEQKEEIEAQNTQLAQANETLLELQGTISLQNQQLAETNSQLEYIVEERTNKLKQAVQELDTFIYRTSHDIRGPLARLLGLCLVANIDVKDTTALDYFEKLYYQALHLDSILTRLSVAYEINQSEIHIIPINFNKLQDDLLNKVIFVDNFGRVDFQIEVDNNLYFESDYNVLLFMLSHLTENAIKFQDLKQKEPYVKICIQAVDHKLVIQITDNGIGIPASDVPYIFDMFSKAADKYRNTGMGLFMVKRAAAKLNGTVSLVESSSGLTQFQVVIPCKNIPIPTL